MRLGTMETAGKIAALLAPVTSRRKAAALARTAIVAGLALGCCLACDSGPRPSSSPAPVSSRAAGTAPTSQYLSSLASIDSSGSFLAGDFEVNGRHYPHSVIQFLDPGPDSVSYDLGRRWRTLDMTLGLSDSSTGSGIARFQVTADKRLIYTGNFTLGQSRNVRLNVVGVARVDLTTTLVSGDTGSAYPAWSSAELLS